MRAYGQTRGSARQCTCCNDEKHAAKRRSQKKRARREGKTSERARARAERERAAVDRLRLEALQEVERLKARVAELEVLCREHEIMQGESALGTP